MNSATSRRQQIIQDQLLNTLTSGEGFQQF